MFRIHISRIRAATAAALLSLSLAAPALAGHDDWNDGYGEGRGYPVHRHERSCDHERWRGNDYGDRGGYGRDRQHREEYGCRPCGRRFSDESRFHRHLARQHGVPYWAIPRVLVYSDWGWIFRG
jgi:hypothetical protein